MSVPPGTEAASPPPGLFTSVRSFWSVLVAILYTRLDLVTAELEDLAARVAKLAVAGIVCLHCLFMAYFFAMFFILALFWDTQYRLWIIGGIFAVYCGVGVGVLLLARQMIVDRPAFLSQTLSELRRDLEGLRQAVVAKKDEVKP
jgi:uncharacterized membrane protein YqjE